jgi:hypothetical protein
MPTNGAQGPGDVGDVALLVLVFHRGRRRVCVRLHVVDAWCLRLVGALPVPGHLRQAFHAAVVDRVRPLLHTLSLLRQAQDDYQARENRFVRACGVRRHYHAVLDPVLLHDASTLYLGCASSLFGGTCRFRAREPCGKCRHAETGQWWALSSTPPAVCGSTVRRDTLTEPVAFCLRCLARRQVSLVEVVQGWDCPGLSTAVATG